MKKQPLPHILEWYLAGHKLVNLRPYKGQRIYPITVQLINGIQVRSNPARTTNYSFDDPHWALASEHPEIFI